MKLKPGIKLVAESEGSGQPVRKGDRVIARLNGWLSHGEPIQENQVVEIDVGKRVVIPGIEYSLEGMKPGGKRKVKISPHLGYKEKGVENLIPPNAVLVYEIELLEVK